MYLTWKKITAPKEYYHDPIMTDMFGYTVAILLALNGIIPPKEW